jgi:hypothetical protein
LHNVRDRSGFCDFDKVKGLEGIYIANIYDKDHLSEDTANKKIKKTTFAFRKQ